MSDENKEDAWKTFDDSPSVGELNQAVMFYKIAREKYEVAKKEAQFFHTELETCEIKLQALLEHAGMTKYFAEDIGTINIVNKYSVKTPKELSEKRALWDWIMERHGEETLQGMLSINSQTLNSFVNELKEQDPTLDIPGLAAPTHEKILRFTSKK